MILITGAASGIGLATTKSLASQGYRILAGCRRQADFDNLKIPNVTPIILDVTSEVDLLFLKDYLAKLDEDLDAIVNNAGVVSAGPLEFISIHEIKKTFEINVWGLLAVTQICLPYLRKSKGKVINISSISGRTVTPFLGPYNASKYAVEVFTDALRMEMLDSGVQFVLIEPGSIETPIWKKSEKAWNILLSKLPVASFKYYDILLKKFENLVKSISKNAAPAQTVVDKIVLAVQTRKPNHRYLVGSDARLALLLNILPSRYRDRLMMKMINSQRL